MRRTAENANEAEVLEERFVPRCGELIQRVAFGNNGGALCNSCSAVAMSIALNYLAARYDARLVPERLRLEERRTRECNAEGSHAQRFHRYLVEECELGPKYHLGRVTWGVWGARMGRGLQRYLALAPERAATGLGISCRPGGAKHIVQNIDAGLPALVTTWFGPLRDAGGEAGYGWHTMAVYGYRTLANGGTQLCVHSGWYSSPCRRKGGVYQIKPIWLPARATCMSYCFSLPAQAPDVSTPLIAW